jgi:hypothetical protein
MALGKSDGSSSFRMSTGIQLPYVVCLAGPHAHEWDLLVPTATGVYDGLQECNIPALRDSKWVEYSCVHYIHAYKIWENLKHFVRTCQGD